MSVPSTIGRGHALFLGFLLTLSQPPAAQAQTTGEVQSLRLRWIPNHTYVQETTTETTTVLTAIGQAADQKMKIKQTTQVEATEKAGGEKEARVHFTAITGETEFKGEKMTFDSANPSAGHPLLQKSLGQSIGSSFVLIYDKDDQFTGVRDTGSMAPASEGTPTLPGIVEAKQVAELYRRSLEMGLPKTEVKPGDRWSSQETIKFPSAGTVNVELRARFDAVIDYGGRAHAKITFEGEMRGAGDALGRIGIAAGSTTFGQVFFDLERSTVSFASFRADIGLEIDGRKIPVRQQVTTKLTSFTPSEPKN